MASSSSQQISPSEQGGNQAMQWFQAMQHGMESQQVTDEDKLVDVANDAVQG